MGHRLFDVFRKICPALSAVAGHITLPRANRTQPSMKECSTQPRMFPSFHQILPYIPCSGQIEQDCWWLVRWKHLFNNPYSRSYMGYIGPEVKRKNRYCQPVNAITHKSNTRSINTNTGVRKTDMCRCKRRQHRGIRRSSGNLSQQCRYTWSHAKKTDETAVTVP